jgi:hypothetical protein
VPLISIGTARPPFSRHSLTLIQIGKFGFKAFLRRNVGFKILILTRNSLSANIGHFVRKALLVPSPRCVFLPSRKTKSSVPIELNHVSSSLGIMKIASGEKAINLLLSSAKIRSVSSPVWLLRRVVFFVKATVKMHSAKEFSLPMR